MSAGRLLVVDDSPTVRKLVELTFARSGWQVEYAASGGQALETARRSPPDVILLDFVLPDMRGLDVCDLLSKEDRTRGIPIVVMSGKGAQVAELFRGKAAFHSAIGKPSNPQEIRAAVEAALAARGESAQGATFQQREAAAKAIYALLREPLAQIPKWMAELGAQPAAPYFARKLLNPELMGRILGALSPHVSESRSPSVRPQAPTEATDASFQGAVRGWPVAGLVTFLEASARTGELSLIVDGETTVLYLRAGEVILVTNREPTKYLRGVLPQAARLGPVSRDAMRQAEAEQRASGTPVFVTLATSGHFPLAELTEVLRALGRKLLLDVVDATEARFSFRDLSVLPTYVEAHGRHVSFARNTLVFGAEEGRGPESLTEKQLALVRLRQTPTDALPASDQVFVREAGFSARVQSFELTASERRVLALVDGASSAGRIAGRSGLPYEEALATLGRLREIGLLRAEGVVHAADTGRSRPLMILEPDVEGFQSPLASLLENRAVPVRLLDLAGEKDVLAAVRREQPRAVILNAGMGSSLDTARRVRAASEFSDVVLVAVVEPQMADRTSELLAAGFDTTLVKPIAYSDIERLLQ
jgi:DNA-binding response OmpR family regulator